MWSVFVKFVLRSRDMWSVFVKFVLRSLDSAEHAWLHVFSRVAVVVVAAADRQTDSQPAQHEHEHGALTHLRFTLHDSRFSTHAPFTT